MQLAAVDGTFYPANAEYGRGTALGKGYTVYNGPDHSVVVTGLQPSTVYYITNAEYNTDGTTILYNTRSSNVMLSTPAAPRPAAVTAAPLPVTLTSFMGELSTRGFATLRWTTATEQNTAYFGLERSTDGVVFAEAGQVAAGGNSTKPLAYSWPDPQPLAGPTYYRLRQTDRDGANRYSSVITLTPPVARNVEVYPNPSAGQLVQVLLQGFERETLTLSLADALGRQVASQTLTPTASRHQTLLPTGLAAGTYFLTLTGQGSPVQKRLVVSE
ncbi:T9SS type A sorting domain-containing protein [Hymenobacter sp. UV11]|uniref:T9SS type A sorting domain-containing protein n=1 Tax=Hymenobacter sp. UV11 TaxID=1849735 RepID=UPI0010D4D9B0|nr:T9SS type A sorting domain-containing protein [Hymenobacter sp. UV11]TDN38287.1 hypothetical protein A8B98_25130 [Hymenobacter sp. UV11]